MSLSMEQIDDSSKVYIRFDKTQFSTKVTW